MAALFYGSMHIIARRIGGTESAATMVFYILCVFIAFSVAVGLLIGDGRYEGLGGDDLRFLLRAWAPVNGADVPI